ncbi:hypothetical protein ACHAWF_000459, partial [Thalassiosira exigua]
MTMTSPPPPPSSMSSPPAAPSPGGASADDVDPNLYHDPLPPTLREGDHFLLHFADGRQLFAQALPKWRWNKGFKPCKINKRTYPTHDLIGLPYGTVLEVGRDELVPLPEGEDLLPDTPVDGPVDDGADDGPSAGGAPNDDDDGGEGVADADADDPDVTRADNRHLIDDNTSQKLTQKRVKSLVGAATPGSRIVAALVAGSATYANKTAFSQAKYLRRKRLKYQPRCRIVRVAPATLCAALHLKDPRRIANLREDTLGRILSDANVKAGGRVLTIDGAVQGVITASCVRKMGGYGTV